MKSQSVLEVISARMQLYSSIREYFSNTNVVEVEVPLLGRHTTTDPHIESVIARVCGETRYLQSSPEFFLKRLLAQIGQSCFCITKAFRDEEQGRKHNPEFSMLEWYRLDYRLEQIIEDCIELVQQSLLVKQKVSIETYQSLFEKYLDINPHSVDLQKLQKLVAEHTSYEDLCETVSEALQLLLTTVIEPNLGTGITVLMDFPVDQAAMAEIKENKSGQWVAKRFELYLDGVELANGYQELTDAVEQRLRFETDNQIRTDLGKPALGIDESLLRAMQEGLPACSGVSIGLDRLLMAKMGIREIDSAILFPWSKA